MDHGSTWNGNRCLQRRECRSASPVRVNGRRPTVPLRRLAQVIGKRTNLSHGAARSCMTSRNGWDASAHLLCALKDATVVVNASWSFVTSPFKIESSDSKPKNSIAVVIPTYATGVSSLACSPTDGEGSKGAPLLLCVLSSCRGKSSTPIGFRPPRGAGVGPRAGSKLRGI